MDILYIEDNINDANIVVRLLKLLGITEHCLQISDGEMALQYIVQMEQGVAAWPKLILMDIKLPKVDGFEILEKIKRHEKLAKIPVVMFSASSQKQDQDKAYSLGANSYLVKPNQYGMLKDLIQYLGIYWIQTNQVAYRHENIP